MPGIIGILTGTQQKVQFIQKSSGTVISIDCTMQENHSRESIPSEFEIENGETISDNILLKPFALEIHGMISDTPIKAIQSLITTAVGVALPPAAIVGAGAGIALMRALAGTKSPSVAAYVQLLQLQELKKPFDVLTTLRRYTDMWIKSLTVPRDAGTGRVLSFQVNLVQLLLVRPKTVNIQIFNDADLAAENANLGKQETTNPALERFKQGQAAFHRVVGE